MFGSAWIRGLAEASRCFPAAMTTLIKQPIALLKARVTRVARVVVLMVVGGGALTASGALTAGVAHAQSWRQPHTPVSIVEVYGGRTLEAGAAETFRARIADRVTRPVVYAWDFGDGTLSQGNMVTHRYSKPGSYKVMVVAKNPLGRDTAFVNVFVVPAIGAPRNDEPALPAASPGRAPRSRAGAAFASSSERTPSASVVPLAKRRRYPGLYGADSVDTGQASYTWVLATDMDAGPVEYMAEHYRDQGYRTAVYIDDSGSGSRAYRLIAGQFATADEALDAKGELPYNASGAQLMALPDNEPVLPVDE